MEEEKKETIVSDDKKKSNVIINIIIILVITFVSIIMYAKYVGTKRIKCVEYRVASEMIPTNFSGVKIIYFSDVLLGSTVAIDDIDELINSINEMKPDIVLFGGNLVSEGYSIKDEEKSSLKENFSKINVTLGKYSVKGFEDTEVFDEVMTESGFIDLTNNYELIYKDENTPICLVGVGSYNLGNYNLESSFAYKENNRDCYTILFTHEGDIINKVMTLEVKPNMILAGNSLGGEIDIPFYGPVNKFDGSLEYFLPYQEKDGVEIYISNGIGTRDYFMRLNNRPSYSLFRLKSIH